MHAPLISYWLKSHEGDNIFIQPISSYMEDSECLCHKDLGAGSCLLHRDYHNKFREEVMSFLKCLPKNISHAWEGEKYINMNGKFIFEGAHLACHITIPVWQQMESICEMFNYLYQTHSQFIESFAVRKNKIIIYPFQENDGSKLHQPSPPLR